jgi:hypothetical protein
MKQNKQMYEAPKVELIEMETQGVLCSSAQEFQGTGLRINTDYAEGAWVL